MGRNNNFVENPDQRVPGFQQAEGEAMAKIPS
jgi:hypothetical protein